MSHSTKSTNNAPVKSADKRLVDPQQKHPVSRREAGKTERRRRIIDAAHGLIRETGSTGLSMRALAARAGVSLATPYNLFGSKRAIIWAVLGDVRDYQSRFARLNEDDPMERIFAALTLSLDYYKDDHKFYKILWSEVFDITDGEVRGDIFSPRWNEFWRSLIAQAIEANAITKGIGADIILQQLVLILRAAMFGWVVGEIPQEKLTPIVICGTALMLKGAATKGWQAPLQARLSQCLEELEPEPA